MNFIDTARIYVKAGKGGDGCLSFRREKYIDKGGPDGGNGGKGGDIWLEATKNLSNLLDFAHHPHVIAGEGDNGQGSDKYGRAAEDRLILAPVGTVVLKDGKVLVDLKEHGQRVLLARGGKGGRGNAAFKSNANKAPRIAEKGEPGELATIDLELKLLADVGLAGLPNAGKSTFLARVSNARPKIADYPFTTLTPNLGLVAHKRRGFLLADIPGLIEGAHEGKGLGLAFLRHIERTRVLIHLVDPQGFMGKDSLESIRTIEAELASFGRGLKDKPTLLVVNKLDLPEAAAALKKIRARFRRRKVFGISAATGEGVSELLDAVIATLAKAPEPPTFEPPPPAGDVLKVERAFRVRRAEGGYEILGPEVDRLAHMTDFTQPEAARRFQNIMKKMGVEKELRKLGVQPGDVVRVGDFELEWSEGEIFDPRPKKGARFARFYK